MAYYDEKLQELQRQIARKQHLEAVLTQLYSRRNTLKEKVDRLAEVMHKEQDDVDRLERGSLAAFFYQIVGNKEEKLEKEREEAYAAKVKYDAAAAELSAVEEQIASVVEEVAPLKGCEARYEKLLEEKAAAVKASGSPEGAEMFRLEEQISKIRNQIRELNEAIAEGDRAWDMTQDVLNSLNSAEGWSTWDMFGGGLIADMAKHSNLDDAQWKIEGLQYQLTRFRSELADVTMYADVQVNLDGFLRFADYFFDGLFVDWMVRDKIHQSQQAIYRTEDQIGEVLQRLRTMLNEARMEELHLQEKLDQLIVNSRM